MPEVDQSRDPILNTRRLDGAEGAVTGPQRVDDAVQPLLLLVVSILLRMLRSFSAP